jgi:fructose-1,6-bisphosphatase/inositol monophosphatase family enzyme
VAFRDKNAEAITALLRQVALTEIMPRFRRLGSGAVRAKSSALDLVTDADEAAERAIRAGLNELHPGALVVGEEACEVAPALLDGFADAPLCFLVDPLDGTSNFAAGLPLFGMMVAVLREGEVVAGVIHDPVNDETMVAVAGGGAWLSQSSDVARRLCVGPAKPVSQMTVGLSWSHFPEELKATATRHLPRFAGGFHFRTAAHEYRLAAAGLVDVLCYNRLMPWDHAAGALAHQEAGGFSAQLDGRPYSPLRRSGGILVAPSQEAWSEAREALFGS